MREPHTVLFLCTGNSCRSILAEALLNHHGGKRFKALSAGSFPSGRVHRQTLATLERAGIAATGYYSKSWDVFAGSAIDIVITVCDAAAGETCPLYPGAPLKAHWGVSDPAHFQGNSDKVVAEFNRVFNVLRTRINALLKLPLTALSSEEILLKLKDIAEL